VVICQVIRELHPNGGSSGVAFYLKKAFDEKGIENIVITTSTKGINNRGRTLGKLVQLFEVLKFTFLGTWQIRNLRKQQDTVVIVHNDALGGDIYVDHGLHKEVVLQKPSMFLRNPIHLFLFLREEIRHRFKTYQYIVSLSEYSENLIFKHYKSVDKSKVVRISNGVNIEKFSLPHKERQDGLLKLIFVGHEYERKGLRFIIEALSLVDSRVTLTVVGGSGSEIASHTKLAESFGVASRVSFLGRRSDVEVLLSEHDILVLPSRFESWQLVVLEAMAAGLPVLGTPVGCAPEVIKDGETGYIIEESAESIAHKVELILANPASLNEMRKKSIALAHAYSWEKIADKYIALAERVYFERKV
jgi:glycosyltransferase involved in cell wall biosynthesis